MAIQNRRGQSADFVASKMVPGEFAVSQDNRKLYLCFTAGNVKEIAIAEDMANAIAEMNLAMKEWHDEVVKDTEDKVEDAEAWAQGTRGGTPVSSTDPAYQHNAKYYAENIVDNTLSIAGKAADAKKTGDEISDLKDDLSNANIFNKDQVKDIRQLLMAKDNIGINNTGNVEVFEKLITPTEVVPFSLYSCSNNQANPVPAAYGCYKKFTVTPGETYYLTGRHYYTDRPFYILLNQSGNVVSYYDGGTQGHDVDNFELLIPNNATTLIVNGSRPYSNSIIVTQTPEILQQNVYDDKLIALKSGSTTRYEFINASYAKCVKFNIDPSTGYCLIGGRHYWTDRPLYMITDTSGNVLKYYDGGGRGEQGHDSEICCFGVPANSAYVYVNVAKNFASTVKLYKYGSFYTLNKYVDDKINIFVSKLTGIVYTPQMFGAKANGTNDDTTAIQNAIEAAKGKTVFFPFGTYAISSPIQTYKNNSNYTNLVFAEGAKVIALQQVPYLLNLGVLGSDTRVGHVRKILRGGYFDGSNGNITTAVVHISSGCMTLDMSDFQIDANGCDGIHVGDSGSPSSIDANIHNGFIRKTDTQNTTNSGIKLFGTDNNISDMRVYYFKNNIEVLADTQFLNDIHTLATAVSQGDASLYIHDSMHINCSNFYGDSEDTFVYLGIDSTLIANNLYYYSYRSNRVTVLDVHDGAKLMLYGFHLHVKNYNYIGMKLSSSTLAKALSTGNFVISGMDIEGVEYLANGDPLKSVMSSDGQPLFNTTALSANTWYYVCSYPADANTEHWFKLFNGFKYTVIPVNVKYANGLADELLSNVVDSDDTNVFDIGFSLLNTTSGYALINVYVKASTATKISDFLIESKLAVGGSTVYQKSDTALSSATVSPSIVYQIDCTNKTITKVS